MRSARIQRLPWHWPRLALCRAESTARWWYGVPLGRLTAKALVQTLQTPPVTETIPRVFKMTFKAAV